MIDRQPSCNDIFEPGLLSYDEALTRILTKLSTVEGYEQIPIEQAYGRTLFTPVTSNFDVPPHDNSAVDGYAFNSNDIPEQGTNSLKIDATLLAGQICKNQLKPGHCIRIMTGAMIPEGADLVAMQEHVELTQDSIIIDRHHRIGQNIRKSGEDIKKDEIILDSGRYLTPPDIGLIASIGISEVKVKRKLVIALASTGNEIHPFGTIPETVGIYDSNRYSLSAALSRPDIEISNLGIIKDDPKLLLDSFQQAGKYADLILSTGGVSVGEADFTKTVLSNTGSVEFWKIAIKPGRPLAFGKVGQSAFFGLPGNPVAVMVTFYLFVLPALDRLMGTKDKPLIPTFKARCTEKLRKKPGRTEVQRGIIQKDSNASWSVRTTGKQGSGILRSMSQANAFIILEHSTEAVEVGDWVTVMPFAAIF